MSDTQKNASLIQYVPPYLSKGKEWMIRYYCIYPPTGLLKLKKVKVNHLRKIAGGGIVIRQVIKTIAEKLAGGWNPFLDHIAPKAHVLLFQVFDTFKISKYKELSNDSIRSYNSYINHLKEYVTNVLKTPEMYVYQFDAVKASSLMLLIKQQVSSCTYNNYLRFYRSLFSWMVEFSYLPISPFAKVKKVPKKQVKKRRIPLEVNNRKELQTFLQKENFNFLVMCMLCYYCFLRPKEISYLKVGDIDIRQQVIKVRGDIAKNGQDSIRTIPDVMMPYFQNLKLDGDSDNFLFSFDERHRFVPGKLHAHQGEINRYWREFVRPELGFSDDVQFYSLKDTGITNMLADGVAPNFVQGQADHSSLEVTSIYARSVTPESHKQIREKAASFGE